MGQFYKDFSSFSLGFVSLINILNKTKYRCKLFENSWDTVLMDSVEGSPNTCRGWEILVLVSGTQWIAQLVLHFSSYKHTHTNICTKKWFWEEALQVGKKISINEKNSLYLGGIYLTSFSPMKLDVNVNLNFRIERNDYFRIPKHKHIHRYNYETWKLWGKNVFALYFWFLHSFSI